MTSRRTETRCRRSVFGGAIVFRHALRLLLVVLAAGSALPAAADAARPLETAIFDPASFEGGDQALAFSRTREAGATSVRLWLGWASVAPQLAEKPADFNPRDPADPQYYWPFFDQEVTAAVAAGLDPIVMIVNAPEWAERQVIPNFKRGTGRPSPAELRNFAIAAARRYSGDFAGLPRVRRWQVWNEPNGSGYLNPQYDTPLNQPVTAESKPVSPDVYRPMVNALAAGVHSVHRDNVVVAGGLSPFGKYETFSHSIPPLDFMRRLLCMNKNERPARGCNSRVHFDAWSMHPYTQGDPTHHASFVDNVSLGDLPKMARLLRAATRAGHVVSRDPPKFWVTEFGWDTKPPDPEAVPIKLHARWVSEALYRMWQSGITLATWFELRDDFNPNVPKTREITSGLYFRCSEGLSCDRPKLSLRAFTFPFVAFRGKDHIRVWGRTPASDRATVTVQQRRGGGWRTIATLQPDRFGIFKRRLRRTRGEKVRAAVEGARSVPFSLKRPPDRPVYPFGGNPCDRSDREPGLCD